MSGVRKHKYVPQGLMGVLLLLCASVVVAHPGVHHDIERVSEAIKKQPNHADLLIERGVYFRLEGNFAASLSDFDLAGRIDPANLDIAAHRGITFSAMGRYRDAEQELTRFIEGGRTSGAVLAARAETRVKLGHPELAIADLSSALLISPDVELYIERSNLEESIGHLDQAAIGLREGLAALGGAVVLRDRLIDVEVRRKQYDAAIRAIDEQLAVTAVRADWYLRRAEILKQADKSTEAQEDRLRALDEANRAVSNRASAIHQMSRARVLASLGRIDEAKKDVRAAMSQSPHIEGASELLARLDKAADPIATTTITEKRGRQ